MVNSIATYTIWYQVNRYDNHITQLKVTKVTDHTLTVLNRYGFGRDKESRMSRSGCYATWGEARAALVASKMLWVETYERHLEDTKRDLSEIMALQPPQENTL